MIKPEAIFVKRDTFQGKSFSFVYTCNFKVVVFIKTRTNLIRFPMNSFEGLTNTRVVLDSNSVVCPSHSSAIKWEVRIYIVCLNTNDIPQFWLFIVHGCLCTDKGVQEFMLRLAQITPNVFHVPSTTRRNYLNFCKGKLFSFRNDSNLYPIYWSLDT